MANALIVEGIARATGATRTHVQNFLDAVASKLDESRDAIARNISSVVHSGADDRERADAITGYAQSALVPDLNFEIVRFVAGIAGMIWGTGVVAAGLKVGVTTVALGLGVEVSAAIAILIGIAAILICGRIVLGVLSELLSRLEAAWTAS